MSVVNVTAKNFENEIAKSALPVLVDFWAEWCGPCKMMSPIIDEIANDLKGQLKVGKVNVDEEQDLAGKFSIMSIPTFLIFKKGEAIEQIVGAMSKDHLIAKIKESL